jgi:hypothetical protein
MWWITIILMVLAGIANAIMDVLKTRYNSSIFASWPKQTWLKPSLSWRNKWKDRDSKKGPKFFGSTTFLVWLTDFWHLAKFLMLMLIAFALVFSEPMVAWYVDFFIYYCSFTIPFEIFYSKVLIKS